MEKVDIAVIGAGVVGCATARQLALDFSHKMIVIIERNPSAGQEASSHNSGVLHSGFHHPIGSLKERLANDGSKLAKEYALTNNIPMLQQGMLIAIPRWSSLTDIFDNIGLLRTLAKNAKSQKLQFSILGKNDIKELEPNIQAKAGLFLPDIALVDSAAFVKALVQDCADRDINTLFDTRVFELETLDDPKYGHCFAINHGELFAKAIINCAGAGSDIIANLSGIQYTQYFVRGEYYEIIGDQNNIVNRIISPAVIPGSLSKGMLICPRPDGRLFLGPNFKQVRSLSEKFDRTPPEEFLSAAYKFLPELKIESLRWAYSGVRSKLSLDGDADFSIKLDIQSPPLVNNIGIDSPGLSASMAIAKMNSWLLRKAFVN